MLVFFTVARIQIGSIAEKAYRRIDVSAVVPAGSEVDIGGPPTRSSKVETIRRLANSSTFGFRPISKFAESLVLKLAPLPGPIDVTDLRFL